MLVCRFGISVSGRRLGQGLVVWLCLLVLQASPVGAQNPAVESPAVESPAVESPAVEFVETDFPQVREGYVSLRWKELDKDAYPDTRYRLADATGAVLYLGEFPEAFVSGLPDGTYTYHVQALDAEGEVIGQSTRPAVVQVTHWPMSQAITAFVAGLVVFLALIGVIVRGEWTTGARR